MTIVKDILAVFLFLALATVMADKEPPKLVKSGQEWSVNPAHAAWVKRQHRDDL
jgi:hypothetical protein